jgi:hypothetical protein
MNEISRLKKKQSDGKFRKQKKATDIIIFVFQIRIIILNIVGFEVLTAVSMKIAVFWVVAPCSLVEVYQRFRGDDRLDDGGSKDL